MQTTLVSGCQYGRALGPASGEKGRDGVRPEESLSGGGGSGGGFLLEETFIWPLPFSATGVPALGKEGYEVTRRWRARPAGNSSGRGMFPGCQAGERAAVADTESGEPQKVLAGGLWVAAILSGVSSTAF